MSLKCLQKKTFFHEVNLILIIVSHSFVKCEDKAKLEATFEAAKSIAQAQTLTFMNLFDSCTETTMANQQFASDNLHKYIVWPPRTTVGHMPKFTGNRKFFANMLSSLQFREMLSKDESALRSQYIEKMKYCDSAVMDPSTMIDFYDREVDQTKI